MSRSVGFGSAGRGRTSRLAAGLLVLAGALLAPPASARISYGPVTLSGNLETQNILRVPDLDQWSFVQQRNTFRLEYDHMMLDKGAILGMVPAPFLQSMKFFAYYRLVYDTIYDIAPGPRLEAMDGSRAGGLDGVGDVGGIRSSARTDIALDNQIRELYTDFTLSRWPLSFRIGKQQIVWGNANLNQRALDSVNALDLTWHFNIESGLLGRVGFSELRRTAWTAKMLYNVGDIGPLGNVFVELYDIPFDFHQTKARQLPSPWSAAFRNPVRPGLVVQSNGLNLQPCFDLTGNPQPTEGGLSDTNPLADDPNLANVDFSDTPTTGICNTEGRQTSRLEQGLFDRRDPFDVNQVGGRIGALLPYSIGFTFNYMYRRSLVDVSGTASSRQPAAGAFATSPVPFVSPSIVAVGTPQHSATDPATGQTTSNYVGFVRVPLEFYMPYVHVFGVTFDYFEDRLLQGVINAEMAWTHNNPIAVSCTAAACPDPMAVRRTDMMLAALSLDRPTWIRPLNKGRVFDTATQLNVGWQPFHDDLFVGSVSPGNKSIRGAFLEEPVVDELEELTLLSAFVINTTYWGGSLIPVFAWVSDWTVAPMFRWDAILQYLPTPYLILETQFRVFWTNGKTVFDRFGQGQSRLRDELILKATYQF